MSARLVASLAAAAACGVVVPAQEVLWRAEGSYTQVRRGLEIHRLGDVNGDGWEDLIEHGAGLHSPGQRFSTELFVTSGRDGSLLSWNVPPPNYNYFPWSLAPTGDMDRDGVPDYAGTIYDSLAPTAVPTIEVRSGRDHHLVWSATVPNAGAVFYGNVIAGEVDLDGDGRNDLITSATRMSPGGTVIAYSNVGVELYRIVDPRPDLLIGVDLAPLGGDLDGDGCGEFLMACPDVTERGAVVVVSGRTGSILRVSYGEQRFDKLSFCTGTGDLDGDGVPDYAGGGYWGLPVVRTFSGATGQPIHTWRVSGQGNMGWNVRGGYDLDQDGVNDLVAGAPGEWTHALSGRDGTVLYSFFSTRVGGGSCVGDAVALLAPPPGERYPLLVYSEHCWSGPSGGYGVLWAVRGSPPGVRSYGFGDASAGQALARQGMRDLDGPLARFSVSSVPPGVATALVFGCTDQSIVGLPLPVSLDPLGLPGITLWNSSEAVLLTMSGTTGMTAGHANFDLRAPLAATGLPLFAQWLWLDPWQPARHGSTAGHRFQVR